MLDVDRIRDKLDELQRYLEELEEDLPQTREEYTDSRTIRRACERTFQLASEELLDICNIIISEKRLPVPKDNRDSIRKLAEADIITEELSSKLQDVVGFRNLLVHRYAKVDDSRAYDYLRNETTDLYEFIEAVEKFLLSEG
jgi:uncharacterized protein YutE (UPF0331/DUF86 family)